MNWTGDRARAALGLPPGDSVAYSEISTDTRTLKPGALFVALAGDRFDGHDHLAAARDAGALGAVVRRGTAPVSGLRLLEVDDTLVAYGRLARAARRLIGGPVVAVTGSNGKTSTREMLAAVVGTRYQVHATRFNLNNLVGIPQTILAAPDGTEALVIEAGANQPGEIARAREIIEPGIAVVTNVTESHLEGFGSLDGVMREKLALLTGVPLAIVGTHPPALAHRARAVADRVVTGGLEGADVVPDTVAVDAAGHPDFRIDGVRVRLPFPGMHQAGNAMLAWAVVRELDLDRPACAAALESLQLPGGRGEVFQAGGYTVVHDAYNANPASFRAAIATAQAMRPGRRLVFVAGSMRELGPDSPRLHEAIAEELLALQPDLLAVVGDFVPPLERHAARLGPRLITAPDPVALVPHLLKRLQGDELIVLKASRGVALERILPGLGITTASH